ncbi:MAG: hypothetical protein ACYSTY_06645, partial [Planctomycetota bacterium]
MGRVQPKRAFLGVDNRARSRARAANRQPRPQPPVGPKRKTSFLQDVNLMFDRAAATLSLPPGLADQIKLTNAVYQVRFPVKFHNSYRVFTGWRATHSEHRLPAKG